MKRGIYLVWLFILATSIQCAIAEPMPRRWTSMSMDDVDPAPYHWEWPCGLTGDANGVSMCSARLKVAEYRWVTVHVLWIHQSMSGPFACSDESLNVSTTDVWVQLGGSVQERASMDSSRAAVEVSFENIEGVNREVLRRIGRDILRKFELYAIRCKGDRAPSQTQVDPGETSVTPFPGIPDSVVGGDDGTDMPGCDHLGVLGQSDPGREYDPCLASGADGTDEPRAYRSQQSMPSTFPPGTKLVALQFWSGPKYRGPENWVPYDKRRYGYLVAKEMTYLYWELELKYPDDAKEKPFEVDTIVHKDGREYARYTSGPQTIDPGKPTIHGYGWGNQDGGFWVRGSYRFELFVNGEPLASKDVVIK